MSGTTARSATTSFANNAVLGGHVTIGDHVVFGGGVAVRQFVRIGEGAMIVGLSGVRADVIPFGLAHGPLAELMDSMSSACAGAAAAKADIQRVRAAYQALFFGEGDFARASTGCRRVCRRSAGWQDHRFHPSAASGR